MQIFPGVIQSQSSGNCASLTSSDPNATWDIYGWLNNGICEWIAVLHGCPAPPNASSGLLGTVGSQFESNDQVAFGQQYQPNGQDAQLVMSGSQWYAQNCVQEGGTGSGPSGGMPTSTPTITQPPTTLPPVVGPPQQQPPACNPPQQSSQCFTSFTLTGCDGISIPSFLTIGSPDFCRAKDTIKNGFIDLGNKIIAFAAKVDFTSFITAGTGQSQTGNQSGISNFFNGFWNALSLGMKGNAETNLGSIKNVVTCWWNVLNKPGSCNIADVAILSIVKAALEILQRFRIGWDIAIWGTLDVTVHIPPMLALLDYLINDACPAEIPSPGDTIEGWIKGSIPDDLAMCWMSLRGCSWDVWSPVIYSRRERLSPQEFIQWQRRNQVDDTITEASLRAYGFIDPKDRTAVLQLFDELPTISDFLHWLQRNVFDSQYVADYNLMDGFEERFWTAFGVDLRALGVKKEYAALHYAAHWINPSLGQLAEMLQRLRPGRVDPSVVFTEQDYFRLLAEQDVAPYFRERLRAIAYRTLPIRQLTSSVKHGLFDRDEVIQRWQDIGYSPDDATKLADAMIIDAARQEASAVHGFTPSVVSKLAAYDLITVDEAKLYLNPQGFSDAEIGQLFTVAKALRDLSEEESRAKAATNDYAKLATKAFGDGIIDQATAYTALRAASYSDDAANLELSTITLRVRMEKVESAVKSIRKAFLSGELSAADALAACGVVGVLAPTAADLVQRWSLELTIPRKAATTGQIVKWASDGLISIANAQARLTNLGWSKPNVDILLLEIDQTITAAKAKANAKKAKLLAESIAAANRAKSLAQRNLCRLWTKGNMIRWYSEGIIDESVFRSRFTTCGIQADTIDNLLAEAKIAKDKADATKAKANAHGSGSTSRRLSAGKLKSLYAERIIDDNTFIAGLKILGYDSNQQRELLDDAIVAREKKDQQAAKKGATGIEYTGPGAIPGGPTA